MMTFSRKLMAWYKKEARDLPWRKTRDPYKIWISEVMLQQTTVNAVIPFYERWVKEFPAIEDVASAKLQKVLKYWQGLGYYARARNIHKASQIIVKDYQGAMPSNVKNLKALPGFGPYTVGAVLSIAFDQRQPIIDANIRRVVMRLMASKGKADVSRDERIYKFLLNIMPQKNLKTFNQAMMELGALVCRSKEPVCSVCPVYQFCQASKMGIQELIPEKVKRPVKKVDAVVGVIKKGNKYLIQRRPPIGLLAGLWEFPGGKIKNNESLKQAISREIFEELGADVSDSEHVFNVLHYYTQFKINLHVMNVKLSAYPGENDVRRWVGIKGFRKYPMPSGSARILEMIKSRSSSLLKE